jgi:thymidylate synthase
MHGIPVLNARGNGIAEAWENSLITLAENGCDLKTMYDKPDDPPSKDASMTIVVEDPLAEPMIHKDFPGGLEDLEEYAMEVVEGIKNHLVRDPANPDDTRWEYTYNERLFAYRVPGLDRVYDQVDLIAAKLAQTPYSRRAQAITWKVWEDNDCYDPACLQSLWCRITEEDGRWYLSSNVRFRSNDAYKAAFMNMFALVRLQELIARRIGERTGREVGLGRYVHQADSYHIYGAYFNEFRNRFLAGLQRRDFADRTFRYEDVKDMMTEARPAILAKARTMG